MSALFHDGCRPPQVAVKDLCIIAAWPYQPSLSWYRAASVISPPCNGMLEGPSPPTHRHAEATFKGCRSF
ncbi:hypothetical protein F7725_005190 [Dissostichus mawsoni]|uniref:Uncharacterized protein n=1 Tax=Dissostichus mawsoni TaxID=36200 RepID=A0A7J5YQW6_DISMA|nr:hypothetical protein F7725_005175 [Dissostichus mawsoni]KAF3851835.1 hypothetical protein F7725_005190 [Dissostichus mawsoni]